MIRNQAKTQRAKPTPATTAAMEFSEQQIEPLFAISDQLYQSLEQRHQPEEIGVILASMLGQCTANVERQIGRSNSREMMIGMIRMHAHLLDLMDQHDEEEEEEYAGA